MAVAEDVASRLQAQREDSRGGVRDAYTCMHMHACMHVRGRACVCVRVRTCRASWQSCTASASPWSCRSNASLLIDVRVSGWRSPRTSRCASRAWRRRTIASSFSPSPLSIQPRWFIVRSTSGCLSPSFCRCVASVSRSSESAPCMSPRDAIMVAIDAAEDGEIADESRSLARLSRREATEDEHDARGVDAPGAELGSRCGGVDTGTSQFARSFAAALAPGVAICSAMPLRGFVFRNEESFAFFGKRRGTEEWRPSPSLAECSESPPEASHRRLAGRAVLFCIGGGYAAMVFASKLLTY